MKAVAILIASLLFSLSSHAGLEDLTPSFDHCHFYLDLEKKLDCMTKKEDPSDYLILYGYRYCSHFKRKTYEWPEELKSWTAAAGICLQQELLDQWVKLDSCPKLEEFAFASHPGCYVKTGFCQLPKRYKLKLVFAAASLDILLRPVRPFRELFRIIKACSNEVPAEADLLYDRIMTMNPSWTPKQRREAASFFETAPDSDPELRLHFQNALQLLPQ